MRTELGADPTNPTERTGYVCRQNLRVNLSDWVIRPLSAISRRDVEARFHRITDKHGWAGANQTMSVLRSIYRRPCVDHEGFRNPVELWLAAGGKFHRMRRRQISAPSEVLPRWAAGIEAVEMPEAVRDILWIGLYTGMRLGKVNSLQWERIDLERQILRVDETKTGEVLELPITKQLARILERRRAEVEECGEPLTGWVFPSAKSRSGHIEDTARFYGAITDAGGTKFWFHGLRNSFITVAERELLLPRSLTKRLLNHARDGDVTEGYAADWTVEQLREPAQRVADRIDALASAESSRVESVIVSPPIIGSYALFRVLLWVIRVCASSPWRKWLLDRFWLFRDPCVGSRCVAAKFGWRAA